METVERRRIKGPSAYALYLVAITASSGLAIDLIVLAILTIGFWHATFLGHAVAAGTIGVLGVVFAGGMLVFLGAALRKAEREAIRGYTTMPWGPSGAEIRDPRTGEVVKPRGVPVPVGVMRLTFGQLRRGLDEMASGSISPEEARRRSRYESRGGMVRVFMRRARWIVIGVLIVIALLRVLLIIHRGSF